MYPRKGYTHTDPDYVAYTCIGNDNNRIDERDYETIIIGDGNIPTHKASRREIELIDIMSALGKTRIDAQLLWKERDTELKRYGFSVRKQPQGCKPNDPIVIE